MNTVTLNNTHQRSMIAERFVRAVPRYSLDALDHTVEVTDMDGLDCQEIDVFSFDGSGNQGRCMLDEDSQAFSNYMYSRGCKSNGMIGDILCF